MFSFTSWQFVSNFVSNDTVAVRQEASTDREMNSILNYWIDLETQLWWVVFIVKALLTWYKHIYQSSNLLGKFFLLFISLFCIVKLSLLESLATLLLDSFPNSDDTELGQQLVFQLPLAIPESKAIKGYFAKFSCLRRKVNTIFYVCWNECITETK